MAIAENIDLRTTEATGPTNSMLGKFYCRISLGEYKRPSPFGGAVFNKTSSIYLPLPDILRDTSDIKYNSTDSETVGDIFNGDAITGLLGFGYRNLGRIGSDAISKGGGAIAGALAAATGARGAALSGRIGDIAGETLAEMIPADKLQTALEQKIGAAPNPNPSIAFEGPSLRSFSLNWTFFPTSATESENVFKIIKLLKKTSLPAQTFSNSGAILNYPYMCQLNFFPWDSTEDFGTGSLNRWGWTSKSIMRYKKCVMTNVDVDYNPSNVPGFFKDTDQPVAIRLSISFNEIEYMLSNDWESGLTGSTIIEDAALIGLVTGLFGASSIGTVTSLVSLSNAIKPGSLEAQGETTP